MCEEEELCWVTCLFPCAMVLAAYLLRVIFLGLCEVVKSLAVMPWKGNRSSPCV